MLGIAFNIRNKAVEFNTEPAKVLQELPTPSSRNPKVYYLTRAIKQQALEMSEENSQTAGANNT